MDLHSLEGDLKDKLRKKVISSNVLLSSFRLVSEDSKKSSSYQDPIYFPFFYYLGQLIKPKNFFEIGFDLGLSSGCFLKSCKSVEKFLAFQQKKEEYYSFRLSVKNIKDVYKKEFEYYLGNFNDLEFNKKYSSSNWDLVFVNYIYDYDKLRSILDSIWDHMEYDGYIVVDHLSEEAVKKGFLDFSKIKNRENVILKTRYLTGILQK